MNKKVNLNINNDTNYQDIDSVKDVKEVEENEQRRLGSYARSLIEASLDPLVTISKEGIITDVNNASVVVTGTPRNQLIGTDFSIYFTEPLKAQEGYKLVFKNGFVADYPLTIKSKDGNLTDVLYNASVYKNENGIVLGVFASARDITEQKRISNELIEAKIFAELATSLAEEAQNKAEKAESVAKNALHTKQLFLSNMSHEIRTPMNAILGFTKVLLKTDLTEKQHEYLSAIKISGDALIVLINDILDLAKVDAGKMSFEQVPFKMYASVSAMLQLLETKIQEKNLKIISEYDPRIPQVLIGDPLRLHQIILNLLSNAVKFTLSGKITVSVSLESEDDINATIKFSVTDTGIGIPANKIDKIFDIFQQATTETARLYGGTGLGLAIVKQLVELQGGAIEVKSQINKGSTFNFTMSFRKTPIVVYEIESRISNTHKHAIKVLVVEDILLNQLLIKTLLEDFGFQCDIADNGKIAIDKMQADFYDVILMDLQMPVMNGFETTAYIRKNLNSTIPILALSADVTSANLTKCKLAGMNDYIAKPIDERLLYNKLINLIEKSNIESYTSNSEKTKIAPLTEAIRSTNLTYLYQRTKSNPKLMLEMISAYLEQTPTLINAMMSSYNNKNYNLLQATMHKIAPSFSIMGIKAEYEIMAKKILQYATAKQDNGDIRQMVLEIENICKMACTELQEELKLIKIQINAE